MQDWFAARDGQRFGPYSQPEIEHFLSEGRLTDADQIWVPAWQRWSTAAEVRQAFFTIPGTATQTPSRMQTRTRRRPAMVVLTLAVLLVAAAILLLIRYLPTSKTVPGTKTELRGTLSVGTEGGTFEKNGIRIEIDGSAGQPAYQLEVYEIDAPASPDPGLAYQSRMMVLQGDLSKLGGDIGVTLPIPEEALPPGTKSADDLDGLLYLALDEDVLAPSLGKGIARRVFLPATIDLDRMTLTAVVPVDERSHATLSRIGVLQAPIHIDGSPEQIRQIRLQILTYRQCSQAILSQQGHFQVLRPGSVNPERINALLEELERQKQRIEALGFSFSKRYEYPIDVYLENIEPMGLYSGSKLSDQGGILTIRRSFLEDDMNEGQWQTLVSTVGHELMHLVQAFYDARGSFSKNSPWYEQPSLWLDEAVATWYEAEAIANPSYLSPTMLDNTYFSEAPLFFPKSDEGQIPIQGHGYGASLFMRFLTNQYGKGLPSAIYRHFSQQAPDDQFAGRAVNDALLELGTGTTEAWVQFVEDLRQRPASIIEGLNPQGNRGPVVRLDLSVPDKKVSFNPGSLVKNTQSNSSEEGSQAILRLRFSPQNLTNQTFFITPATLEAGNAFSDQQGEIRIKVTSTGACGLMVYTLAAPDGLPTEVAGSPDRFLSSDSGTNGQRARQSEITIPSFGSKSSSVREIRLVVVNYDDSESMASAELDVEISYGPKAVDINGEWALSMVFDEVHYPGNIEMWGTNYLTDINPGEWFFFTNLHVSLDDQAIMYQEDAASGSYVYLQYFEPDQSVLLELKITPLLATMSGTYDPATDSFTGPMENYVDGYGLTHSGRWKMTRVG